MYQIYADDTLIYDSTIEDYKIGKGSVLLETNKSGSFTFSIYPDHFFYDGFVKLKTIITVYKSGKIIFRGRILNDVTDYWNNKVITCEGELGFLQDSIIRPFSFSGTPDELFVKFINEHNSQVDEFKRFEIGNITVLDPNNYIARSNSAYESALSNMNSRLIEDSLGGYFHVTHGADGTDPTPTIHYLADFTKVASQTIRFGSNLKDYTKTAKSEELATAIIPLGAEVDDGDDTTENPKLTIESVNDGVDYVYDEKAVETYGWIFKVVEWDDVTDPENLKNKAKVYLQDAIKQSITIELNAIDLHLLDHSIESFKVGDYVRVISEPHNFAETLLCHRQTIDLLKPENDTVTLGRTYSTFTETIAKDAKAMSAIKNGFSDVRTNVANVKNDVSGVKNDMVAVKNDVTLVNEKTNRYKLAEQQLTALMSQSFGVFTTQEVGEDGSTVSYMHDEPNLADSKNIWKMTENAFAVSNDGGATWSAGLDADGNAIFNILSAIGIEASWIRADNLSAISANLGGWNIDNRAIYKDVTDPNDSKIVHRVYFQPPVATSPDKTAVLSCLKSTDGGKSFSDAFALYADGTARFGEVEGRRVVFHELGVDVYDQYNYRTAYISNDSEGTLKLYGRAGHVVTLDRYEMSFTFDDYSYDPPKRVTKGFFLGNKDNEDGGGFYNKLVLEVDDIVASGNVKVGNAVSTGQFTTNDGQIVWVTNGIITDITW